MKQPSKYYIELYYAHTRTTEGVYHAFEAADPEACNDDNEIAARLADILHTTPDDPEFVCAAVLLSIPKSLEEKIQNDTLKQHITAQERPGHGLQ